MDTRFIEFTVSLAKLNKLVQKLKLKGMKPFDLKGTHTLCIYQLLLHENGMLPTDLADCCDFDPGLVSRTLRELSERGIVCKVGQPGKYLSRYYLTENGKSVAMEIDKITREVQGFVDTGIEPRELDIFYRVLRKLEENFQALAERPDGILPENHEKPGNGKRRPK